MLLLNSMMTLKRMRLKSYRKNNLRKSLSNSDRKSCYKTKNIKLNKNKTIFQKLI